MWPCLASPVQRRLVVNVYPINIGARGNQGFGSIGVAAPGSGVQRRPAPFYLHVDLNSKKDNSLIGHKKPAWRQTGAAGRHGKHRRDRCEAGARRKTLKCALQIRSQTAALGSAFVACHTFIIQSKNSNRKR